MRTAMTLAEWKNKRGRPFFFSIQTGQQKLRAKRGHHHQVKWKYKYRHGMAHHGRESSISPAVLHFFIFSWLVGVGKNSPLFALVKFEIRPGDFICSSVSWLFTFFFKCNMRERERVSRAQLRMIRLLSRRENTSDKNVQATRNELKSHKRSRPPTCHGRFFFFFPLFSFKMK